MKIRYVENRFGDTINEASWPEYPVPVSSDLVYIRGVSYRVVQVTHSFDDNEVWVACQKL